MFVQARQCEHWLMPKWRINSSQKGWQTDIIHIFSAPTCIDIICQPTPGCCWSEMHLCRELSLKQSKLFNFVPNTFKRSMIVQNPPQRFKIRNDFKFYKKAESGTSSTSCCCLSCSSFVLQSSIIITWHVSESAKRYLPKSNKKFSLPLERSVQQTFSRPIVKILS